jgi:glutaredoxin
MLKIYGAEWCGPCRDTKKFLDENNVDYTYINIDDDGNQELINQKEINSIPYCEVYDADNNIITTRIGSITTLKELEEVL